MMNETRTTTWKKFSLRRLGLTSRTSYPPQSHGEEENKSTMTAAIKWADLLPEWRSVQASMTLRSVLGWSTRKKVIYQTHVSSTSLSLFLFLLFSFPRLSLGRAQKRRLGSKGSPLTLGLWSFETENYSHISRYFMHPLIQLTEQFT